MKKILNVIALVAVAVLPVVSCSIEIEPEAVNPATPSKSVHASIELPDDGTKVFVNDNLNVCWEEGDEISVFDHLSFNSLYRFAGTPGEPSGDFNLVPETNFYTGNELPYAYAVYPYSYSNVIECYDDKTVLRLTSPQVQLYVPGSFGPGTNLMVSVSEDDNLRFKNVCGYFVLKLYGDDVTVSEVTIFTPDGTSLCGSMNVCMSPGEAPVIDGFYGHANYVTVKCDTPVKLGSTAADATEFWFVVPPVTMEQGFTARITLDNGLDILAQKTGSVSIERNKITRMAAYEVDAPKEQYFLNPKTGEPAVFTLNEGWWNELHAAKLKYYEMNGVRMCTLESDEEGIGIWGDSVGASLKFNWYLNENNSEGNNLVEVQGNYFGFDYNGLNSVPETDAVSPVYCYDWYWLNMTEKNIGMASSWLEYARQFGNPDGDYPACYYDGNGGFHFNLRYYVRNMGGFSPPAYDFVAISDGFVRDDEEIYVASADAFMALFSEPLPDKPVRLVRDITLPDNYVPGDFSGTFDGGDHTITYNLNVPADATYNSALFSKVAGTVKNLKVAGTITSVASTAANVGGIAGVTGDEGADFENCESSVVITAPVKASFRIGGIVGLGGKDLTLKRCVNRGAISHVIANLGVANSIQIGGIVGHLEETGSVENCINYGSIVFSGKGNPRIGGICGYVNNLVEVSFINCRNAGAITLASNATSGYNYVGGISGYYGTPNPGSHVLYKNCINEGNITHTDGVDKTSDRFGGILCHCGGTASALSTLQVTAEVTGCSNSGNITCTGNTTKDHIGGIIAFTESASCIVKCDDCTNTGSITVEGNGTVGGILGYSCNPTSTFTSFHIGKDVVLQGGSGLKAGLVIGSGYLSGNSTEVNTALTGDILGGKIVKGTEVTEISKDNYRDWLAPYGFVGSVDGVSFTGSASASVSIKIDGDFDDWANVPSAEPAASYKAFKVWNDDNNFYFYVETDPGSRLWSGGAYLYLYFNFKNDLTQGAYTGKTGMGDNKYDAYIYMYLFGGSADAPKIENNPNGGGAEGMTLDNIVIAGNQPASASDIVKMEIVIPRANFTDQVNAGAEIAVDSFRSKDGGNVYFPGYVVK